MVKKVGQEGVVKLEPREVSKGRGRGLSLEEVEVVAVGMVVCWVSVEVAEIVIEASEEGSEDESEEGLEVSVEICDVGVSIVVDEEDGLLPSPRSCLLCRRGAVWIPPRAAYSLKSCSSSEGVFGEGDGRADAGRARDSVRMETRTDEKSRLRPGRGFCVYIIRCVVADYRLLRVQAGGCEVQ